ncbi:MAG: transposase [Verrucomicrobiales bacterium]|nr:transposase [Verrucomicrobiales bacterium]
MRPEYRQNNGVGDSLGQGPHRGWYSRGYLPHFDRADLVQSLTFRLGDSIPANLREQLENEPIRARQSKRLESLLDKGIGACHLRNPDVAEMVENALLHFDGVRYRMLAWVIMPNHVHCVFETIPGFTLTQLVHCWKSYTAHEAAKWVAFEPPFWWPDYRDRFVRDFAHFESVVAYIHRNPVSAGLCETPEDWLCSSASKGRRELSKVVMPDGTFQEPPELTSVRHPTGTAGVPPAQNDRDRFEIGHPHRNTPDEMEQAGRLRSQCVTPRPIEIPVRKLTGTAGVPPTLNREAPPLPLLSSDAH